MRILLTVLAWGVMVGAVLGAIIGVAGAYAFMRQHGSPLLTTPGPLVFLLGSTAFRLAQAFGIGLGLLFLLDLDKRLRQGVAHLPETR